MSWLGRRRRAGRLPRAKPSPRTLGFHFRRSLFEGFDPRIKPPVVDSPLYGLAKVLLAHPISFDDYFYMSLGEYTGYIVTYTLDSAARHGWEGVYNLVIAARSRGVSKDPPLVSGQLLPERSMITSLLSEYPVSKIRLYLHIARKQGELGLRLGWGERKRRAVAEVLESKGFEWNELQAIKYPKYYRELLRMAHPKPPNREFAELWAYLSGKGDPPTARLAAALAIDSGRVGGDEAVRLALDHRLPWEVVRSRIGNLSSIDGGLLAEAARRLMSGWDLAMQARSLASIIGEDKVAWLVGSRASAIHPSAAARAAIGLSQHGMNRLARLFASRAVEVSGSLRREMGIAGYTWSDAIFLVDASSSMSGQPITAAARILLALGAREAHLFNSRDFNELNIHSVELREPRDYAGLTRMTGGGTPLYSAIKWAVEGLIAGREDTLLVVVTDEQENASRTGIDELARVIGEASIAIINPAPYPAGYIPKQPLTNIVGLPGSSPEAVIAAARILALSKLQSEGVAEEKLLEELTG